MAETWEEEMRGRARSFGTEEGDGLVARLEAKAALPFAAPRSWLALAKEDYRTCRRDARGVPLDPILAQTLPSEAEFERSPDDLEDPLGEGIHSAHDRIIHQYGSRVLLRSTGECPMYCRHCFRRSILQDQKGFIGEDAQEFARRYLAGHPEVREVLVSGGDPLTASTARLEALLGRLRSARGDLLLRICTRSPVTLPSRIDSGLVGMLRRFRPLNVVLHINHPMEMSAPFVKAIGLFIDSGIPVHSQTVLLRGVNDDEETLVRLFSGLLRAGVRPYYLFQGDLAVGTAHFRVPLSKGLDLYSRLRRRLSGLELPRYAVDAPGGGGKVYLPESVAGRDGRFWILRNPDGDLYRYPEES